MTTQGTVDWRKPKRLALWFIPYALWVVAILIMTATMFGEWVGDNVLRFDGPHFVAWMIVVIALTRAVSVWIDYVLDKMRG